jgi:hypothetical protein
MDKCNSDITESVSKLKVQEIVHPLKTNNNEISECETAEEAITTDSEDYLSEPLR